MPNNTNITHLPTDESLAAGLAGIADALGATVDTAMSDSSTNAVQNKVIKAYVDANAYAPLICTMALNGNTLTGDKTFAELKAAADCGRTVVITYDIEGVAAEVMYMLEIVYMNNTYMAHYIGANSTISSVSGSANDYPSVSLGS